MHVIRDSEDDTTFQKFYEKTGIQLTEEPNPVPPSLRNKIEDLHFEVYVNPKATIPELIKLTGKYPEIPVLKNYLFLAYSLCNKNKKAEELLDETIKKHPNYIFGISNKILNIDDHDELLTHGHLLGNPRDVRELVGYDKPIHIIAYISYQQAAAHYEAHIGEDDAAVKRLDNLIELDAPEDILDRIAITIARSRFLNVSKKFKKQIQVKGKQIVYLNQQWKERPKLNHQELEIFYTTHPDDLSVERRDYIMSLPKETLVLDLENILLESMLRWEYYRYTDWDENTHNFLLHALYFLGALKSEQSLPKVLELLKMGEEFVDYWFADTFESILAKNNWTNYSKSLLQKISVVLIKL